MKVSVKIILGPQSIPYIGYAAEPPALGHSMTVFYPVSDSRNRFLRTGEVTGILRSQSSSSQIVRTSRAVYEVTTLEAEQIEEA